jgi:glycosyltransferase involved in cell wall biosynthesis
VRILLANHTGDWSGAEVALLRLAAGLRAAGHTLAVACPREGRVAERFGAAGMELLPLPAVDASLRLHPVQTPRGVGQLAAAGVALARDARRWRADVVHANSLRTGLSGAVAARLGCPPIVVQVHEHLPPSPIGRAVRRVIAGSAAAVVGVTDRTAASFDETLPRPVAERAYISIDHDRFDPARTAPAPLREELGLGPGAALLGEVAQITPWKGQDVAVRALARMRAAGVDAHLVLAGRVAFATPGVRFDNQAFLRDLRALIAELGVQDAVHLVGERDSAPLFGALDLSVLPSWNEPFGTVAAESMAMGVPPMVTSVGGVREYVEDGVNGRVLDPHRPEAWAEAALELLADRPRLARMGEQARRTAARFTDAAYAGDLIRVYERVARRRSN